MREEQLIMIKKWIQVLFLLQEEVNGNLATAKVED